MDVPRPLSSGCHVPFPLPQVSLQDYSPDIARCFGESGDCDQVRTPGRPFHDCFGFWHGRCGTRVKPSNSVPFYCTTSFSTFVFIFYSMYVCMYVFIYEFVYLFIYFISFPFFSFRFPSFLFL